MAKVTFGEAQSRFKKPHIQSVDLVLAPGARLEIQPDDLRLDGTPRWIQRIIWTEHTLADMAVPPAAPDPSFLPQLVGRWYVRGRWEKTGVLQAVHYFDSQAWERHTPLFNAAVGQKVFQFAWRLDAPVTVKYGQAVFADMFNPAMTAAGVWPAAGAPTITIALHGKGLNTGWTRVLYLTATVPQTPGGGAPGVVFTNGPGADGRNNFGEDIEIDRVVIHADDVNMNTADSRAFNHLRLGLRVDDAGIYFSGRQQGEWPPIIMYGSHRNLAGRVAIMEPLGAPLVVDNEEAIGLDLQNTNGAGVTMRAQVGIVSLVE